MILSITENFVINPNLQDWQKFILRVMKALGSVEDTFTYQELITTMKDVKYSGIFYKGTRRLKDSNIERYWDYLHNCSDYRGIPNIRTFYNIH